MQITIMSQIQKLRSCGSRRTYEFTGRRLVQQAVVERLHGRVEHLHGPQVEEMRLWMRRGRGLALDDARGDAIDAVQ
jgi:hypothetical protein